MNKSLHFLLLCCVVFCLNLERVKAQNIAGGEIYYELISPLKYKVTAHIYRICSEDPLTSVSAKVYGGAIEVAMSFQRVSISKIHDTCGNPCNKQNAISNPGYEKHTFLDTVDFNAAPYDTFVKVGYCVVYFGIRKPNRAYTMTTFSPGTFYIDACTNICLSNILKNTSPQFSIEPKFEVAANMTMTYSPGPLDTMDNDSFGCQLDHPLSNNLTYIVYNSAFSATIPMTPFCLPAGGYNCKPLPSALPARGFYFDPLTCNTVFTPINTSEVGTIKYKINEYRYSTLKKRYEWLGYVTREMIMSVRAYNNAAPSIPTGIGNIVCKGNEFCATIKTSDPKSSSSAAADTTHLFWDAGIKGASFKLIDSTAREVQGKMCWPTKNIKDTSERFMFTMASFDRQCNIALTTKTYTLKLLVPPKIYNTKSINSCGLLKWSRGFQDTSHKGLNFTTIYQAKDNKILYVSYNVVDSLRVYANGNYIIKHVLRSDKVLSCPVTIWDTLAISNAIEIPIINNNKDSIICLNSMANFKLLPSSISNYKSHQWFFNDTLLTGMDSSINLKIKANSKIKCVVENKSGCKVERTLNYNVLQHKAIVGTDSVFCYGKTILVKANVSNLRQPLKYEWTVDGLQTTAADSLNVLMIAPKKVFLKLTEADQCQFTDSVNHLPYTSQPYKLSGTPLVCSDSLAIVKAKGIDNSKPYFYLWKIGNVDIVNRDSTLNFYPSKSAMVTLKLLYTNGCTLKDSIAMNVLPNPQFELNHSPYRCIGQTATLKPVMMNRSAGPFFYEWKLDTTFLSSDSIINRTVKTDEVIYLKVSNALGCVTDDTANVFVYPNLRAKIKHSGNYHPSSFINLTLTQPYPSYTWSTGSKAASLSFWARTLGPAGNYTFWCKVVDANGCASADTVTINTNSFLKTHAIAHSDLSVYPNPVGRQLNIISVEIGQAQLFTLEGRLLQTIPLAMGLNQVNMETLASGVYLLRTEVNGQVINLRIVKD